MANRKVTIQIDTKANTSGATQATQAMDKLAAASTKAAVDTTAAGKAAGTGARMFGQAGLQIQDAAVQIGAGTSKLTILSQQLPQLLGAFGPAGAIAGAVIAVGAVATQIFMKMGDDTMSAEEKAKKLAKTLEKITEAAQKAVKDDIDFGRQRIEDATTAATQLAAELNNAASNQISLNDSIAKSLQGINEAEMILEDLRGESNDKLKLQAEQEAAAAARRQEVISKQMSDEKLKVKIASDALEIARNDLIAKEAEKAAQDEKLKGQYEALKLAREQLAVAKELAAQPQSASPNPFTSFGATGKIDFSEQNAAKQDISSGASLQEVERLKATVIDLQKMIDTTLKGEISDAQRTATELESNLTTTIQDVDTSLKEISAEANMTETKATAKALEDKSKLVADELKTMIEGVEGTTDTEKAAIETLKTNLSDKQIDLTEINSTTAALTQLGPLMSSAIEGNAQKVSQLITLMGTMVAKSAQLQSQIDNLQRRMSTALPSK